MKKILFVFLILLFIYFGKQFKHYRDITKSFLPTEKKISTYYNKYADAYCVRPANYQLLPEMEEPFKAIQENNARNNIQNCILFKFAPFKFEERSLNGYFKFNEENLKLNKLTISIDNNFIFRNNLTTSLLILHETSNAYETLKAREKHEEISCFEKESLAYQVQAEFIKLLKLPEKITIFLDLSNRSIRDSSYELLRRIVWEELKSEIYCLYDEKCRIANTIKGINTVLTKNEIIKKYCENL